MSYAISKKFSKEPESSAPATSRASSNPVRPTTVRWRARGYPPSCSAFPGDSITAIVIGVLYMKNMNPGPTLFTQNPQKIYAVYLLFILANLLMIPLGWLCIKAASNT